MESCDQILPGPSIEFNGAFSCAASIKKGPGVEVGLLLCGISLMLTWVPSLNLGHQKPKIDEASLRQRQEKAKRVTERRKCMLERDAEKIVAEKLQTVNKPGVAVKSLPFNVVDVEMDDIEDLPDSLPDSLRNVVAQTDVSTTTVCTQTRESHNSMLQPEPLFMARPCSGFDEVFWRRWQESKILHWFTFVRNFTHFSKIETCCSPS